MVPFGTDETISRIVSAYSGMLLRLACTRLGSTADAEDAVQEAFLALTRHLDKVEDVYSPRTKKFLATIVRSKAVDLLRRQKPEEEFVEYLAEESGQWAGKKPLQGCA